MLLIRFKQVHLPDVSEPPLRHHPRITARLNVFPHAPREISVEKVPLAHCDDQLAGFTVIPVQIVRMCPCSACESFVCGARNRSAWDDENDDEWDSVSATVCDGIRRWGLRGCSGRKERTCCGVCARREPNPATPTPVRHCGLIHALTLV